MPEPFTLIYIASYIISGIIGGKSNEYFDLAIKSVSQRLLNKYKSSENDDVLKAVRRSCLRATLDACKHIGHGYQEDRESSIRKENLIQVEEYLNTQIVRADKLTFDLKNYEEIAKKTELLLMHDKENSLKEIGQKQKDLMIQELDRPTISKHVSQDVRNAIRNGWKEKSSNGDKHIDWWKDRVFGNFIEEYKDNTRVRSILQAQFFIDIKDSTGRILISQEAIRNQVEAIHSRHQEYKEHFRNIEKILIGLQGAVEKLSKGIGDIKPKKSDGEGWRKVPSELAQNEEAFSTDTPFKHLKFYDVEDSDIFFGRDSYIESSIERIESRILSSKDGAALLEIHGTSGSGKSSLMRAGIIGNLEKKGNWTHIVLRPSELHSNSLENPLKNFTILLYNSLLEKTKFNLSRPNLDGLNSRSLRQTCISTVLSWLKILDESGELRLVIGLDQFEELLEKLESEEKNIWRVFLQFIREISSTGKVATLFTMPSARRPQMKLSIKELRDWFSIGDALDIELELPEESIINQIIDRSFGAVKPNLSPELRNELRTSIKSLGGVSKGNLSLTILPLLSLSISKIYDHWFLTDRKEARRRSILNEDQETSKKSVLNLEYSKEVSGLYNLTVEKYGQYAQLSTIINEEANQAVSEAKKEAGPAFIESETITNLLRQLITILPKTTGQVDLKTIPMPEDLGQKSVVNHFKNHRLVIVDVHENVRLAHESIIEHYEEAKEWKNDEEERLKYLRKLEDEGIIDYWEKTRDVKATITQFDNRIINKAGEFLYTWSTILSPPSRLPLPPNNFHHRLRLALIEFLKYQNSPREQFQLKKTEPYNFHAAVSSNAAELVKLWLEQENNEAEDSLATLLEPQKERSALFEASFYNRLDIAKLLLEHGANPNNTDVDGWYPIQAAATRGHLKLVALFADYMDTVNVFGKGDTSTLALAARGGHSDVVNFILEHSESETKDQSENRRTPLIDAAVGGYDAIVKTLLTHNKESLDYLMYFGYTALFMAIKNNHLPCVSTLIDFGADLNQPLRNGLLPLHYAAYKGYAEIIDRILGTQPDTEVRIKDVNYPNPQSKSDKEYLHNYLEPDRTKDDERWIDKKWTALHLATYYGHIDVAKTLIEYEAKLDTPTKNKQTVLHIAIEKGEEEIVELFLKNIEKDDSLLKLIDNNGMTPLVKAIDEGKFFIANLILQKQENLDNLTINTESIFQYYTRNGTVDQFIFLLKNDIDVCESDVTNMPILFDLIKAGAIGKMRSLLDKYPELALKKDPAEVSPLNYSILEGNLPMVNMLLNILDSKGQIYDLEGMTPMHYAGLKGNAVIMRKVIETFGPLYLNSQDTFGWTPLCFSVFNGSLEIVRMLLDAGASIEPQHRSPMYFSPVQIAAKTGNIEMLKLLQSNGATLNGITKEGLNIVHLAVKNRQFEMVNYLVDHTNLLKEMDERALAMLVSLYSNQNKT